MALFGSARDMSLFRSLNRELINRYIDTEVVCSAHLYLFTRSSFLFIYLFIIE